MYYNVLYIIIYATNSTTVFRKQSTLNSKGRKKYIGLIIILYDFLKFKWCFFIY